MPRSETVITVFVASPSDVDLERNKLLEIVSELNLAWSKTLGVRVELMRWETHAYPSAAEYSQAVINEQIGDQYDIFVGIMWGRFGSPTPVAGSGTEEEFNRAWDRYRADAAPRIMFYFKDAPIAPSKIDPDQLRRVQAFRLKLGSEGVLHWSFNGADDFGNLLRLHLARQVQSLQTADPAVARAKPTLVEAVDAKAGSPDVRVGAGRQ